MDPGSVNDALTLITRVTALGKRANHVQYEEALMAAREEILKYKELNIMLREENLSLKNDSQFVIEKGCGWLVDKDDSHSPKYCVSCKSAEGRLHPLQKSGQSLHCYKCSATYRMN